MTDTDQPESLILRQLRAMDIKLDINRREMAALKQHSIGMADTLLAIRKDLQSLDERLARLETRFDLREAVR